MPGRAQVWLLCLSLSALVLFLDLQLPLGVAAAPYVAVVLFAVWLSTAKRDAVIFAALCTVLTLVAAAAAHGKQPLIYVATNVALSTLAIWITAGIGLMFRRTQAELETLNRELEQRVNQRAADAKQRAAELATANTELAREVHERQRVQAELFDSQALYSSLVEDLPIPILRKDRDGRFVFANRAFCKWLGVTPQEIVGKTDFDYAPAALAEKYRHDDAVVVESGALLVDVEQNEHDGSKTYVHVMKTAVRDSGGQIVGTQAIFWDVTARRLAEEALRNSEMLYHSLVDTLPMCLLRKDRNGRFTLVNRAFCEFFGVLPEEMLGKTDFDLFPESRAHEYTEVDVRVMASSEVYEAVEELVAPGGTSRHIHVIKTAVSDVDRNVVGVQVIFRDVSDQFEMEAALQRSEQRLQALLDNTSTVVYMKDLEGKYILANRQFESLFHLTRRQIVGHTDLDLFPPDTAEAFQRNDRKVIATGELLQTEEIAPHEDGPHTYISIKFPLRSSTGEAYAIAGISTDITDRKRAETALNESQQRLDLALASAEIGVWDWNLATGTLTWDERMHHIYGVPATDFCGTYEAFEKTLHPGDAERVRHVLGQCLSIGDDFDIDFRVIRADGQQRNVSARAVVVRDDAGQPIRMTGVNVDITERKLAEEKLKENARQLEATNRELQEFAYIASHDLQEPLRTLAFFSESLRTSLPADLAEQAKRDLDFITVAAERMRRLVQDLLALSRAGRAAMKREPVDLNVCAQLALEALATRVREKAAVINVSNLPMVSGDKTLLTQLFQNLIGNALKFMGAKAPQINVEANRSGGNWIVSVQDNGIGIKPEYAQKIFAPFQRLHGQAEYEGTGIGLAICRKVVERHGGEIWVESVPGEGSKFNFSIPANDSNR